MSLFTSMAFILLILPSSRNALMQRFAAIIWPPGNVALAVAAETTRQKQYCKYYCNKSSILCKRKLHTTTAIATPPPSTTLLKHVTNGAYFGDWGCAPGSNSIYKEGKQNTLWYFRPSR